jgi:tRNA pseudouridine38-40 synthase
MMTAHFDSALENIDTHVLAKKLNSILPENIAIYRIIEVKPDAHARFDAMSRLYRYYVTTDKDPFLHHLKYKVHGAPDIDKMNTCANILFDYEDFTSFSKLHTDVKTNNCTIMAAQWVKEGNDYVFTIRANRFLRNMVRSIAGTLLEAGRGKLDAEGMHRIIRAKDRGAAGMSVPGYALFLEEIEYNGEIFI